MEAWNKTGIWYESIKIMTVWNLRSHGKIQTQMVGDGMQRKVAKGLEIASGALKVSRERGGDYNETD